MGWGLTRGRSLKILRDESGTGESTIVTKSAFHTTTTNSNVPKAKVTRKLALNGKFDPVTKTVEQVPLTSVGGSGQNGSTMIASRASIECQATSPLLRR